MFTVLYIFLQYLMLLMVWHQRADVKGVILLPSGVWKWIEKG